MVFLSIRAWGNIYSCLSLYRCSLCLYSCILKKASSICFCNDHLANKQLMVFLHRCSYRDSRGQEPVPAETQWTYSCLSYSLLFPRSSQTSISFFFFLSFALLPSFVPSLSSSLARPWKHCVTRIPEHWHLFFLRLWENSSSCFLRCFSHSSPRLQITRAQWVGRTRSTNTVERSNKVLSFSSRERANAK